MEFLQLYSSDEDDMEEQIRPAARIQRFNLNDMDAAFRRGGPEVAIQDEDSDEEAIQDPERVFVPEIRDEDGPDDEDRIQAPAERNPNPNNVDGDFGRDDREEAVQDDEPEVDFLDEHWFPDPEEVDFEELVPEELVQEHIPVPPLEVPQPEPRRAVDRYLAMNEEDFLANRRLDPRILAVLGPEPPLPRQPQAAALVIRDRIQQLQANRHRIENFTLWGEWERLRVHAELLEGTPGEYVISCRELPYGKTEQETQLLVRAGPFEVYMTKNNATGRAGPVTNVRYGPEAECHVVPEGCTNNFANWSEHDVMNWAAQIVEDEENLLTLQQHRLDGLGLFYTLHAANGERRIPFRERRPDIVIQWHLEAPPPPPPNVPELSEELKHYLREHLNALHNLLNGHSQL